MKAFVTVMGEDRKGIIAKTSTLLADNDINILDINQTIIKTTFTMVMLVDIKDSKTPFADLVKQLEGLGDELGLEIRIQHEDIFNSMHRI